MAPSYLPKKYLNTSSHWTNYLWIWIVKNLFSGFSTIESNPELQDVEADVVLDLVLGVHHPTDGVVQERVVLADSSDLKQDPG